MKNKTGLATINLFMYIFASFLIILFFGLYVFVFSTISDNLEIDQDFGAVNLKNASQATFGKINTGLLQSADLIGYTILFSMILLMLMNAYFLRGEFPKLFSIIDIVLLVFAYILSVYVSDTYSTFINSTTLLSVYSVSMPKSSAFIINLPNIVGIVGVLMMILSYSGIPRREEASNFNAI